MIPTVEDSTKEEEKEEKWTYKRVVNNVTYTGMADPTNSPDCPKTEPSVKDACKWEGFCRYDRFCCCGECMYTTHHRCMEEIIVTTMHDPDFER